MKQSITLRIGYRYYFRDMAGNLQASGLASCKMAQTSDGSVVAVESVRKLVERELVADYPEQVLSGCGLSITIDAIATEVAPFQMPGWWFIIAALLFMGGGAVVHVICNTLKAAGF